MSTSPVKSSAVNPILARLNNSDIADTLPSTFKNTQGMGLICLVVINSSSLSSTKYQNLNGSFTGGNLAFTQYGSLVDITDPSSLGFQYFSSPFDPANQYGQITTPTADDVLNGPNGSKIFGNIGGFPSQNALFKSGQAFVSPKNAKWILNISIDSASNNVYTIYFNPLNNSDLSLDAIESNIGQYCDLVNNIDPMCFCQESQEICTQAVFPTIAGADALKTKSLSEYNAIKEKCKCLNAQCQFAANTEKNKYAQKQKCDNGASACGASFNYSSANGISGADNQTVQSQCGAGGPTAYSSPSGSAPVAAQSAASTKTAAAQKETAAKRSKVVRNILITLAVVALVLILLYLFTQ